MSLSDKITNQVFNETHILTKDVKEFIQKAKDMIYTYTFRDNVYLGNKLFEEIDKLAGDKLTENST